MRQLAIVSLWPIFCFRGHKAPLFLFFFLHKCARRLVMVAFFKKSVYFPLTCLLSAPLAEVTHLFCLKVNVGQSPLIAKEWIYREKKREEKKQHFNDSSTDVHSNLLCGVVGFFSCQPASQPLQVRAQKLWSIRSQGEKGRKWQVHVTFLLLLLHC